MTASLGTRVSPTPVSQVMQSLGIVRSTTYRIEGPPAAQNFIAELLTQARSSGHLKGQPVSISFVVCREKIVIKLAREFAYRKLQLDAIEHVVQNYSAYVDELSRSWVLVKTRR